MPGFFDRPLDLLAAAHEIDTGGRYPDYDEGAGDPPAHRLELAVATRMAIDARTSRSLNAIWPSNRAVAEEMGVSIRTIQRYRDGTRTPQRDYLSRITRATVRRYVTSPVSTPTGRRKLSAIRRLGAGVVFEGDYSILNWTNPPRWQLRRARRLDLNYLSPFNLTAFIGTARAGAWELAASELEGAFWPEYFGDEGDTSDLEPYWVHPERLTITAG